jgi:Ca2+-binding RTX toxin-like protein
MFGEAGDDILRGGGDDDTLIGAKGEDTLRGGAGNDILDGGVGNTSDVLVGGRGKDVCYVDSNDRYTGCEEVITG